MSKTCIDCGETLTAADIAFSTYREETDIFNTRLFDSVTCKACIMNRDSSEDEELDTKDDDNSAYGEIYSENLDQEVLETENMYQGYDSLGELDAGWK